MSVCLCGWGGRHQVRVVHDFSDTPPEHLCWGFALFGSEGSMDLQHCGGVRVGEQGWCRLGSTSMTASADTAMVPMCGGDWLAGRFGTCWTCY